MNKRWISLIGGLLLFLVLLFVISLRWDNDLHEQEDLRMPVSLGSYLGYGYYKIDPKTIIASLEHGKANIFQPLLEDPRDVDELSDISISWTQADFMRIFSALSKSVWNDSMEPNVWSVYAINFSGGCIGDVCDFFDYAQIVYFKKSRNSYTTRFMDIQPYFGLVRWGDGTNYHQPILDKWKGVELATSKVTAEDALRIAEESGGRERRLQVSDRCPLYVDASRFDPENWHVSCTPHLYNFLINLDTAKSQFVEH